MLDSFEPSARREDGNISLLLGPSTSLTTTKEMNAPKWKDTQHLTQPLVTPELASSVVKNYLLPMFGRKKARKRGLSLYSSTDKPALTHRNSSSFVVSELKLNQDLYSRLQSAEE
jgi:hypothetical protein